jgi:hypothetical protein
MSALDSLEMCPSGVRPSKNHVGLEELKEFTAPSPMDYPGTPNFPARKSA